VGFILRGLLRIRHTGESRYAEDQTGFPRIEYGAGSVKHGMTVKDMRRYPAACFGAVHYRL